MIRFSPALLILLPAIATAQDADRGRQVAERWCSGCHAVSRSPGTARADGIPSFSAIAAMPAMSPDRVRAAFNPLHSRMPDLSLGKREQDDLVAYIRSLRTN
jgi:mono/diheme cytochrome c family protein